MLAVAWRRSHTMTCAIVIIGLLITALFAAIIQPYTEAQVTPLIMVDQFNLLFTIVICLTATCIAVLSFPYLFTLGDHKEEYYLLLGTATVGALVMVGSTHFVSAILGIETLSMALYGMLAYPLHSKESVKFPIESAIKYLVLSAVSSAFMLFGIALIYSQLGTLGFASVAIADNVAASEGILSVGLFMVLAGGAFKLSLAPFHMWTPDVYEGAPTPAAAYLATIGKVAMFVLILRYFAMSSALSYSGLIIVLGIIAVLSIIGGNLLALLQNNLKRLLAYSSIAHMGYLLIAVIAMEFASVEFGLEAISFYLIAYAIMTLGAFGVLSIVSSSEREFDQLENYHGLFWRNPWLASLLIAMLLSLAGIPLTAGFIGKFYLFFAGVEAELWYLLFTLVVGSGIGLYYYLRIVYRMLENVPDDDPGTNFHEAGIESLTSYGVLAVLVLLLLLFGIFPSPLMELISAAVISV